MHPHGGRTRGEPNEIDRHGVLIEHADSARYFEPFGPDLPWSVNAQ